MHAVHGGYTVIARLAPGHEAQVRAMLRLMREEPHRLPFADSATTHFAMGMVLPVDTWGDEELPAALMIATSFCGPAARSSRWRRRL